MHRAFTSFGLGSVNVSRSGNVYGHKTVALLLAAALLCLIPACASPPAKTTDQSEPWLKPAPRAKPMPGALSKPAQPKPDPLPTLAKPAQECLAIRTSQDLDTCKAWAQQGDGRAANMLGSAYERGVRTRWLTLRRDTSEALKWHTVALDAGEKRSLRYLFNASYYGIKVPRDRRAAMEYLNEAAALKQDWALLILAKWSEKSDPMQAWKHYLYLAEKGNCHAMEKVAELSMKNYARPANVTLAYFWAMAVDKLAYRNRSEYHQLWGRSNTGSALCGGSRIKAKAQSRLNKEFRGLAEQEASAWKPGMKEPYLPAPPPGHLSKKKKGGKQIDYRKTYVRGTWNPVQLQGVGHFSRELEPSALFKMVKKSVWVVVAANSQKDLKRKRNVSMGSGVAVQDNIILTNFHVVKGRFVIKVRQGSRTLDAQILTFDKQTDRCALLVNVNKGPLLAIRGYRPYRSLKVGEIVYSVGSPKGLENTLGQGLISGLRRNPVGMRMIQTNAQISKGSSGGGLFDRFGNLLGITTMTMRDSQSLNFAISVEDFAK